MKPWELIWSLFSFLLLVLVTFAVDAILHFFNATEAGRYLGIPGVGLILISFLYSLRKRKILRFGTLPRFLGFHEVAAWLGSLLLLVHAGIHFNALLPWLAIFALLLSIASGYTGRYLLGRSREKIKNKTETLQKEGLSEREIEERLMWEAVSMKLMQKWRLVHHPITILFAGLSAFHIFSVLMFGGSL